MSHILSLPSRYQDHASCELLQNASRDQLALLIPVVVQHYVSHELPGRSAAGEKLELRKGLLGQVVESVH
jgi:hypothetical protein